MSVALDPLCYELQTEGLPQADDALEECEIGCTGVDLRGEAAVDLHGVDREALEIGERRVACPEVVEGELDASLFQHRELMLGALATRNEDALRQLERQEVWRQGRSAQCIVDVLEELWVLKLPRRHVDGDLEIAAEHLAQARRVEARFEQDPAADLHDQP